MAIGELRIKRKRLDLVQDDVSKKLGWNRETLMDIENGRVDKDFVRQIEDAMEQIMNDRSQAREEVMA